jgi:hypothetical protein
MKIQFAYSKGPGKGHLRRSEALMSCARSLGHKIVGEFDNPDWTVLDFPVGTTFQPGVYNNAKYCLVMGDKRRSDGDNEFSWDPLGLPAYNVITGPEFLILDQKIADCYYRSHNQRGGTLLTCGNYDPEGVTRLVTDNVVVDNGTVVIGGGFRDEIAPHNGWNRFVFEPSISHMYDLMYEAREIICTWGMTAIEAAYIARRGDAMLGPNIIPIAIRERDQYDALRLGMAILKLPVTQDKAEFVALYNSFQQFPLNLSGVYRVINFMENIYNAKTE